MLPPNRGEALALIHVILGCGMYGQYLWHWQCADCANRGAALNAWLKIVNHILYSFSESRTARRIQPRQHLPNGAPHPVRHPRAHSTLAVGFRNTKYQAAVFAQLSCVTYILYSFSKSRTTRRMRPRQHLPNAPPPAAVSHLRVHSTSASDFKLQMPSNSVCTTEY